MHNRSRNSNGLALEQRSHDSGATWRILDDGRIVLDDVLRLASGALRPLLTLDDDGAVRTKGDPRTARVLLEEYGEHIRDAAALTELPTAWIAAMVTIESKRIPGLLAFDPISLRDEDGSGFSKYRSRKNRVSAGLMQTLLSTAEDVQFDHVVLQMWSDAFNGPGGKLDLCDLCVPRLSIALGAAYMLRQVERFGRDPVLLVGAYNAGGVYSTSRNPWRIRTYGADRIPKFAAYHNDILSVMNTLPSP